MGCGTLKWRCRRGGDTRLTSRNFSRTLDHMETTLAAATFLERAETDASAPFLGGQVRATYAP